MKHTNQNDTIILLILSIFLLSLLGGQTASFLKIIIPVFVCIFLFIASIRVDSKLETSEISYTVRLLWMPLKTIIIPAQTIQLIHFKRNSWLGRKAVIKRNGSFPLIITSAKHEKILDDVLAFAKTHEIQILKSKDYQILERKYS